MSNVILSADEARRLTNADIDAELSVINEEIRKEASLGNECFRYRSWMSELKEGKLITRLEALGYKVDIKEIYDPPSAWAGRELHISWEEKDG